MTETLVGSAQPNSQEKCRIEVLTSFQLDARLDAQCRKILKLEHNQIPT